jgi:hypothetical protein
MPWEGAEGGAADLDFMIIGKAGILNLTGLGSRDRLAFGEGEHSEKKDLET